MANCLNMIGRKKFCGLLSAVGILLAIGNGEMVMAENVEPCRYMSLSMKPAPDPGEGSFLYYASDYYQHEIYASPDVPTMIAFGQTSRLSKDKPTPEIRLILNLPEGFQVHGGRFSGKSHTGKNVESPSDIKIEGKNYKRFRINCVYGKQESRADVTALIVSTTIKPPQDLNVYYATEIDNKIYHQREIPLHIISIPEVGSPKKIFTWAWTLWGALDDYPEITAFNKIGFSYPDPEYFNRVIKSGALQEAKVEYLRFVVEGDGFEKDPDALCVDVFGDEKKGLACPTYRGKNYQAVLERGKKAIDLGVYEHIFDPEREDGKLICFCPRCLVQFKEWFSVHSNLPYKSPKEFMLYWKKYPEYHWLWVQFKIEKENERYYNYRQNTLNYMEEKGIDPKRFKLLFAAAGIFEPLSKTATQEEREKTWYLGPVEKRLEDPLLFKDIFDYFCPMIYIGFMSDKTDMLRISEELKGLYQYSDGKVRVCPILSVGMPYESNNIEPNGMMKYQILEAFAGGAKGIVLYALGFFDALDMKYFAEAIKQVLPVEDIINDGKQIEEERIKDLNNAAFVKGVESKDGAVILVSEYSENPKEAKAEYKVKESAKVIDLSTGETIATISPHQSTFSVTLDKDRARLFYIEREK